MRERILAHLLRQTNMDVGEWSVAIGAAGIADETDCVVALGPIG